MTLTELQEDLAAARAARLRILRAQEYVIGNGGMARRNRLAELEQVTALINDLQAQIAAAEAAAAGRRRVLYVRS